MPMIRTIHNKENPFIQLNKEALWDKDLSLEAVGLWARLLSRPDDWQISVAELCRSCGCGKDKIHRLLRELIEAGYAYRCQTKMQPDKNKKTKVFSEWETYVFEFKVTKEEIQKMFSATGFSGSGKSGSGQTATTNINNSKSKDLETDKKETHTPPNPLKGADPGGSSECVAFGDFVWLRKKDFEVLSAKHGKEFLLGLIEEMNDEVASTGNKFKDYAATIRKWIRYRESKVSKISKKETTNHAKSWYLTKLKGKLKTNQINDANNEYLEITMQNGSKSKVYYQEPNFKDLLKHELQKAGILSR